jgi:hypothetical protein
MRTKSGLLMVILVSSILFSAFVVFPGDQPDRPFQQDVEIDLNMSDKVYEIVKTSCFDCHLSNSKNKKAKKAMAFDLISREAPMKQISKLTDICNEINDGNMPPEKYIKNFPESELTEAQIKAVCDWVKTESGKFVR